MGGLPKDEVAVRRYEIKDTFIVGVGNFELKRNFALMYAQEPYVEEPPTMGALYFKVQQYLPIHCSALTEFYPAAPLHEDPSMNQQNQVPQSAASPQASNWQQWTQRHVVDRQQPPRASFKYGVADCTLKDRSRKSIHQQVNSYHTNPSNVIISPLSR